MQNTFVASRVELKGWREWRNTEVTMDEAKEFVGKVKILIPDTDMNEFDWGDGISISR